MDKKKKKGLIQKIIEKLDQKLEKKAKNSCCQEKCSK